VRLHDHFESSVCGARRPDEDRGSAQPVGPRNSCAVDGWASRIAAAGSAGDVLVSSTTRDLVAGSGLEFSDRGEVEFKGIGPRRIYAATT
jgi:hypothetical protein